MRLSSFKRSTLSFVVTLLLLVPLLATCGGAPEVAEQPAEVPTADIVETPDTQNSPTAEATEAVPTEPPAVTEETQPSPTEAEAADLTGPLKTPYLEFGIVGQLYYTDHERALQLAQNAGFDWVRQQVPWKDTEGPEPGMFAWDQLDTIVDATNQYGLKLLISIVQSPSFYTADGSNGLPEDPETLGNFVEVMAQRYGNKIGAYEIWNEQNLAHETGGRVELADAGRYVELLIECYDRIKAVTPEAFVLAGAPSSTGVNDPSLAISDIDYYRAMYSYRDGIIDGKFDAQAVHPGGAANPPDTLYPDNPSSASGWTDHPTHYFRHIENVRKVMEEYGLDNHQIWITEYGWATENVTPGYEFGNEISFDQQAEFITSAIQRTYEQYPWVGNMFLWNLNFAVTWAQHNPPEPLHEQASFGILNGDWSPRPSYLELQSLIAQLKAEQGR